MNPTSYSLEELRGALRDLDAGTRLPATAGWDRLDPSSVAVLGVSGGIGTSVVSLAVAEAIGADRLIELCPSWISGLVEASTAELGVDQGWRLGTRGSLVIERRGTGTAAMRDAPGQTVVDAGHWTGTGPHLPTVAALVVVAPCSIPGLRRLRNLLHLSPTGSHIFAVLTGSTTVKALPRAMTAAAGPHIEAMILNGALVMVPACSSLRRTGITGDPLPKALRAAATTLAHHLKEVLP